MEPDSFFSDIAIVGTMGRPQDERGGESLTPETLIIRHCAPTLAALKSSSLVCLKCVSGNLDGTLSRLAVKGVGFRFFTNAHGCHLLFVYRPWALKAILANGTVRRHLGPLGYDTDDLVQCLRMLGMRLGRYDFPHEIGFFWAIRWRMSSRSSRTGEGDMRTAECGRCTMTWIRPCVSRRGSRHVRAAC